MASSRWRRLPEVLYCPATLFAAICRRYQPTHFICFNPMKRFPMLTSTPLSVGMEFRSAAYRATWRPRLIRWIAVKHAMWMRVLQQWWVAICLIWMNRFMQISVLRKIIDIFIPHSMSAVKKWKISTALPQCGSKSIKTSIWTSNVSIWTSQMSIWTQLFREGYFDPRKTLKNPARIVLSIY